ncbi:MAG: DUF5103 domain-containing protein [Cyclobacteriaceae bacterium]|nr:DUF5103 domain-containing protein [Cyclobacteriaceae bacterium]
MKGKSVVLTIYFLHSISMLVSSQHLFTYDDVAYEDNVRTVNIIPADQNQKGNIASPSLPIGHQIPLILSFDILYEDEVSNLTAKIIHCDARWRPSRLRDMEFLSEINEFPIQDFAFSTNTKVPYTHYTFELPRVKLPGNYLILVYRNYDMDQPVLSRRFFIYDQQINLRAELVMPPGTRLRQSHHQIDLQIHYPGYQILNPMLDISVVIRQNHRWDNLISDLKPSQIREDIRQMVYRHFSGENTMAAGNEFRFFDMRSLLFSGQNIDRLNRSAPTAQAHLFVEQSRSSKPFSQYRDINGGYTIQNNETRFHDTESDYVDVYFYLSSEPIEGADVYVGGALNDWQYSERNKMQYNQNENLYYKNILLKQGWYDYMFVAKGINNPWLIEGSFFETNNVYEVIVYYTHPQNRSDIIIGYTTLQSH